MSIHSVSGDETLPLLLKSVARPSAAAGSSFGTLLERFDGDVEKALAAYNWGMGNLARKGEGALPPRDPKLHLQGDGALRAPPVLSLASRRPAGYPPNVSSDVVLPLSSGRRRASSGSLPAPGWTECCGMGSDARRESPGRSRIPG